jgi:hypothetical protein
MNTASEQEPVSPHNAVLLPADQPDVVAGACDRIEPQPPAATVSRLTQAGAALVNTVIVREAMAGNAHPRANEIYATPPAGLVLMDDARGSRRCRESARCVQHGRRPRPSCRAHRTARREHA